MNYNMNIDEYLPLRDLVFNAIRDAILSGELEPGERLMEKQLSEKIGVSRTPVREALRKLELESFVEIVPRRGAVVKIITEKDVKNVLEIRGALEALAISLACENMNEKLLKELEKVATDFEEFSTKNNVEKMAQKDESFHNLIYNASKNDKLVALICNLKEQIYRYRITYLKDDYNISVIIKEHNEIIEALRNKDINNAELVAKKHISNQEKAIIASII